MAGSSKPSTRHLSCRLLKGPNQSSTTEPVDLSDDIQVSEDQEVEAEGKSKKGKELPLVVGKKGKSEGMKVAVSAARGSLGKSGEGSVEVNAGEVYVPNWSIKGSLSTMDGDVMISRMMMSACNFAAMLPEGVSRFRKRMHEYEDFSKNKIQMKASMAALKKESEGFAEKEKAWVSKLVDLTSRNDVEMKELKKEMEADKLKLKTEREALNVQKKAFLEEKERLKASLVQATSDNQWLIEHGFQ
ncbi:hypothetical protein HanRHA438_Chr09g0391881 [Helianthus annuus]|nr:hypothetical protein HanHA300_Chr09g0312051 [Helianthus annuus]KAJ0533553.1 hypothetical protein HanIR_Chr09g0409701 [Helianthus annuus]KAJ0541824.1 hypothetical protein HanHA89_Chr09g0332921 [Helianthus annuus]KAJ0706900.1 hypothetical protein HanLR1_Chr09g0312381 [Helianthus annuus]KAJ0710919.1 hypothetical protein HanOQP8_Chr09g0317951 [Helianthus annuus]